MSEAPASETRVLEALSRVPVFSQLDDKNRKKLARLCVLKTFQSGDVILEEGSMALGLFIVTSGRVEMFKTADGKQIPLGEVDAGGVLGQMALFDDQPRSASAVALDATECLLLTRDGFETLVKRDPQIAWCLVPAVVGRVRDLEGLALKSELEIDKLKVGGAREVGDRPAATSEKEKPDEAEEKAEADENDETSDLESAFYKMMRMQYGLMAGAAKGVTEMSRVMEKFLDSLAEETELKTSEDWKEMLEKIPDAMVTATRDAMDEGEKVPDEMVDAYHRYSDDEK